MKNIRKIELLEIRAHSISMGSRYRRRYVLFFVEMGGMTFHRKAISEHRVPYQPH
jgi:hypothetical protein